MPQSARPSALYALADAKHCQVQRDHVRRRVGRVRELLGSVERETATSAAQGKDKAKSSDKTRKEGDTSGESSDKSPKGETREAEPASEN